MTEPRIRSFRVVRTKTGARLVQDDVVLSEVRASPGPTHTLFDLLAACIAVCAPGPRVCVLGFAGGGIVAPLRAMGVSDPIDSVDTAPEGEKVFRELCGDWAGEVHVARADAAAWLSTRRRVYDLILDDLSVPSPAGTVKPYVSLVTIPRVMRARLAPKGVTVQNLLPLPGTSWDSLLAQVAPRGVPCVLLELDDYENRILVGGKGLPATRALGTKLRAALRGIRSKQASRFKASTFRAGRR